MTREHLGYGDPTPFSNWLRALPAPLDSSTVSNQNLDYVWHDYRTNRLLTIEEKRHRGASAPAQTDTHGVVAQMLHAASGMFVQTMRGLRPVEYVGHYVIRFENTSPDDGRLWINGTETSPSVLVALLGFDAEAIALLANPPLSGDGDVPTSGR